MKFLAIVALTFITWNDPIKINKINNAKSEAKKAFNAGDYKTAIRQYKYLVDSLGVKEEEVMLNLAHAYYLEKDTANAFNGYQSLSASQKKEINSKANQQLGVMSNQRGKFEEALNYFKQAIKADPQNEDARYNYEMLKKKLDEKKKQQQQQQNKDQENKEQNKDQQKDQQNQDQQNKDEQKKDQENKEQQKKEQQNKEQEKKDQQQKEQQQRDQEQKEKDEKDQQKQNPNIDRKKLEEMKVSEEKAMMILEAMRQQEKQYLQQQKRKATKAKPRNKPDW